MAGAGSSGFGVFESAVANKGYTIGIDSDQSQTLTNADEQKTVVTSILKNVGNALVVAAQKDAAGTLAYGSAESLGLTDNAVGYVDNARFKELVPGAAVTELGEKIKQIADGTIKVNTAF